MARLPQPGGDSGNWGDILNDYLSQIHNSDGTLKDNTVTANNLAPNSVTNAAIATNAVNAMSIADGSITEVLLSGTVQNKLNATGGIPDRLYFSGTDLVDGTLPSTGTLNSGHSYAVTHSGATGFAVVNGALQTSVSLCYLNFGPLPGPIRNSFIEMMWTDTSQPADEVGVLIVADGPFANNYPTSYANSGAHVLLCRDRWIYQKRDFDGPPVTKVTHYYAAPLSYGATHQVGLRWNGTTPVMIDPDGTETVLPADTDYALWWGAYGCMEMLGATSGQNKLSVSAFSASSEVVLDEPRFASIGEETAGSTVTSAGTTTLTAASAHTQELTGTTTHTIVLPSALIKIGDEYEIINNSTGIVTVQSSDGTALIGLRGSRSALFVALSNAPANQWHIAGLTVTATAGPITVAQRDNNTNLFSNNFIPGVTTTATSGGTLTLAINFPAVQMLTGSSNHTVKLPTTSVTAGMIWTIISQSSGTITVQSSGANIITTLANGESKMFQALAATPTTAAQWRAL